MSHNQSYAPFGSCSPKNKKKKKTSLLSQQPGPGSYNISLPLIEPIIQTIQKKNNNVIVKLGHIGTASFQNSNKRFNTPQMSGIGPGQYEIQSNFYKRFKPKISRNNAASKLSELIQQTTHQKLPTIPKPRSLQLSQYFHMPEPIDTGNQPTHKKTVKSIIKGADWSKMVEKKLLDKQKSTELGPGYYQLPKNRSRSQLIPSPSFVSESVRSFFDNIRFQTNKDIKARERLQMNYKSNKIGPGSYQLNDTKQKKSKFQFFGSTSQRM